MPMCFFLAVYGKYCLFHMAFFKFWYLLCFQCNVPSHRWKIKAQMKRSQMKSHRWRDHRWRVTDEEITDEETQMKRSDEEISWRDHRWRDHRWRVTDEESQLKRSQMKSHRWRDQLKRSVEEITDEEITDEETQMKRSQIKIGWKTVKNHDFKKEAYSKRIPNLYPWHTWGIYFILVDSNKLVLCTI